MDWIQLAYLAAGLVGGALAKHVMSGAKPVVDPGNTRPAVDGMRDLVRAEVVALFGGAKAPAQPSPVSPVAPVVPAAPAIDLNALLQGFIALASQSMAHVAAAGGAAPADVPAPPPAKAA